MDVEAQDDGIMAKITVSIRRITWIRKLTMSQQPNGSKGIRVGTRIAVLAGPDDDLKTLDIPAEETTSSSAESGMPTASPPKMESIPQSGSSSKFGHGTVSSAGGATPQQEDQTSKATQRYPLYPSVIQLLHENGIELSRAAEIPTTGPNGRLLKGDVLAFLGSIESSYPQKQADRLGKLSHLNLSNINRTTARQPSPAPSKESTISAQPIESSTEIAVPISLTAVREVQHRVKSVLGIDISLETFISRAIQVSNTDLPRPSVAPSADELFDQILGLDKVRSTTRPGSFTPQIVAPPSLPQPPSAPKSPSSDIIDILGGTPQRKASLLPAPTTFANDANTKVFTLVLSKSEEKRGKLFLERVKSILQQNPGGLVL